MQHNAHNAHNDRIRVHSGYTGKPQKFISAATAGEDAHRKPCTSRGQSARRSRGVGFHAAPVPAASLRDRAAGQWCRLWPSPQSIAAGAVRRYLSVIAWLRQLSLQARSSRTWLVRLWWPKSSEGSERQSNNQRPSPAHLVVPSTPNPNVINDQIEWHAQDETENKAAHLVWHARQGSAENEGHSP